VPDQAPRLPGDAVVRFVGDLHLGDGAHNDGFGDSDEALAEFLTDCATSCEAVVFMGDTLDLPQALTPGSCPPWQPGTPPPQVEDHSDCRSTPSLGSCRVRSCL